MKTNNTLPSTDTSYNYVRCYCKINFVGLLLSSFMIDYSQAKVVSRIWKKNQEWCN